MTLEEQARNIKSSASQIIAKRQSDTTLYTVLGGCMELCERCGDPGEEAKMRVLANSLPPRPGRSKHFIERGSDVYQLVARYVFYGEEDRSNINRYAHSLRQAGLIQIRGADLPGWLKDNGGINALYMRRPLERNDVTTRCLRLTESITVPKDKSFTLTLRRTPENTFEVLS